MKVWHQLVLIFAIVSIKHSSFGSPVPNKCPLGENVNSLIGKDPKDKASFVAEEDVIGFTNGAANASLPGALTEEELKECFKEKQKKVSSDSTKVPLPPGVTPEDDPARLQLLPNKEGRDEDIGVKGEYYTTYDSRKYNFRKKGYVIDAPTQPTTMPPKIKEEKITNNNGKNELSSWYNAFVDVVADYV